jgi:hypothetical protein
MGAWTPHAFAVGFAFRYRAIQTGCPRKATSVALFVELGTCMMTAIYDVIDIHSFDP